MVLDSCAIERLCLATMLGDSIARYVPSIFHMTRGDRFYNELQSAELASAQWSVAQASARQSGNTCDPELAPHKFAKRFGERHKR